MLPLEQKVLERIKPSLEEKEKLEKTADHLMIRAIQIAKKERITDVKVQLVGSAARNTWITGTHDLDIFISFDPSLPREKLEEYGLFIGHELAKEGQSWEEGYAEHPYTKMNYAGFDVDIVPCYRVTDASRIISAVDRTPFHNRFIKERIKDLENDVLLLKQFMKAGGTYGSELKTRGFSGYLTELLIIHYGSFKNVLEAASAWEPNQKIEFLKPTKEFSEPLQVIDPTDAGRNVAAALSLDKFCLFIDLCRQYLKEPNESFFNGKDAAPLSGEQVIQRMDKRASSFVALKFKSPDVVEDILYPQLFKMQKSVEALLEKHDFRPIKSGIWAGKDVVLIIELENFQIATVKKHRGPPVWVKQHAEMFREKYTDRTDVFAFYIEDGKYVAEVPRKYTTVSSLLENEIHNCSLGKQVAKSIKEEYEILSGKNILQIKDADYRAFLNKFL
ncbi:CCA tRNA nucleotidyltransferase [Methanohalophilus sp. RSK]|uniref:CCA tRNA nucleotidyltransferase n=1 Tax=Methanohalophilus sp. RSK TaxID=2485783 RepID=UPI000F43D723|nr:CCA tRNA nucleotidyltransferase [Methanohalophilus sp. RSK]RNI12896.1 CCA tRNA nucleotidyltransferase [Methanohalophilus sp. RSK]